LVTFLREGERRFLKSRSSLVSNSCDPYYKHTVKYLASDLPRRSLHVGVWSQRPGGKGQDPALCEGLVEVRLEHLQEGMTTRGWYPLFPAGLSPDLD